MLSGSLQHDRSMTSTHVVRLRPAELAKRGVGRRKCDLDGFQVDLSIGEFRRGSRRRRLQKQALQVLWALLESPGEMVTRGALRDRVWPDNAFLDVEHNLNRAISKLRQALLDSAEKPQYIETIHGIGYRFIGRVDNIAPHIDREFNSTILLLPMLVVGNSRGVSSVETRDWLLRTVPVIVGPTVSILPAPMILKQHERNNIRELALGLGARYLLATHLRSEQNGISSMYIELVDSVDLALLWSTSIPVANGLPLTLSDSAAIALRSALAGRGVNVSTPQEPQRIAIAHPGFAFSMMMFRADTRIVAASCYTAGAKLFNDIGKQHIAQARPAFTVGGLDMAELIKADPDVVFIGAGDPRAEQIRAAGMKVLELNNMFCSISTFRQFLSEWSHLCGKEAATNSQHFLEYWDQQIALIAERIAGVPSASRSSLLALNATLPTIELPRGYFYAIGGNLLANDAIRLCGGISPLRSAFAADPGEKAITIEQIEQWDPDYIAIGGGADVRGLVQDDARWKELRAAKNGRLLKMPALLYIWSIFNPEMILYIQWIAKALYPDRFKDLDLQKEACQFYPRFMGYEMPQAEVERRLETGAFA